MNQPLSDNQPVEGARDEDLLSRIRTGDRGALEDLVRRHQPWIFNLVQRMVWNRADAEDITQEILIKGITRLDTFQGRSAFRTWLYRIVCNHVLNLRATPGEAKGMNFSSLGRSLDETPDLDLPDTRQVPVDTALLVEEAKLGCTMGMLICLDRRQRLAFVLGEILGVTDRVGGDVMEVEPANFRQLLSRARRDLYSFMNSKCGLVNEANPCRCARKTRGFLERGYLRADRMQFTARRLAEVREACPSRLEDLQDLDRRHGEIFRQHPFLEPPDVAAVLRRLVETKL